MAGGGDHWTYTSANLYTANELSLDLFGSYLAGQRKIEDLFKTNIRHGFWGGGVGLNYFLTRNIGVGGDIDIPENVCNTVKFEPSVPTENTVPKLFVPLPLAPPPAAPYTVLPDKIGSVAGPAPSILLKVFAENVWSTLNVWAGSPIPFKNRPAAANERNLLKVFIKS